MRARFIGDPRHDGEGPSVLEAFGLSFTKGQWVNIDGNEAAMRKLPGNNHFEVDKGVVAAAIPAPTAKASPAPQTAPQAASVAADIPSDWQAAHHTKRIAWARQVSGGEVKTAAVADAILTAHFAPPEPVAPVAAPAPKPDDDDGFSDLDPDI